MPPARVCSRAVPTALFGRGCLSWFPPGLIPATACHLPPDGLGEVERMTRFELASSAWKAEVLGRWTTFAVCTGHRVHPAHKGQGLEGITPRWYSAAVPAGSVPGCTKPVCTPGTDGLTAVPDPLLAQWPGVEPGYGTPHHLQGGRHSPTGAYPEVRDPERLAGIEPATFSLATRRATAAPQSHGAGTVDRRRAPGGI